MKDKVSKEEVPSILPMPKGEALQSGRAPTDPRQLWLAYGLAVAVTTVTLLMRLAIGFKSGDAPMLILFLIPITLSAYVGGLGPGLVATAVAALETNYFLLPPLNGFSLLAGFQSVQWVILLVTGVLISVLNEALHQARRRAEVSQQLQAVTLASIGDAIITTDVQGYVTFLNAEAERLTGWTNAAAVGQPLAAVFRIVHEQTRQPVEDPVQIVLHSGAAMSLAKHMVLLAQDGREIPIEDSGAPIKQADGAMQGVVLVFRDCTERQQAEAALRRNEAVMAQAGRIAHLGAWELEISNWDDLHANALRWSEGVYRILGYEPGAVEVSNDLFFAHVHPDDRQRINEVVAQAIAAQQAYQIEHRIIRTDGTERIVLEHAEITFDAQARPLRMIGTIQDITERKEAEEILRNKERWFRALIEYSADSIAVIDQHNHILYLSPSVAAVEGYTPEELIGRNGLENTHPDDLPLVQQIVEQLIAHPGKPIPVLWRRRHKNGHWLWLEGVATNLLHDPAVQGIVTNYRDVTDRKRAEELRLRSQKLEALGTIAGGIAHDFNNILLAITGNTQLAAADLLPDHPAQESLSEIARASTRASDLVRQIMAFSRPQEHQRAVIQLQPVIAEGLKLVRATLPARIEIRTDFAPAVPAIAADATQIHQVVVNLATNAAHAIGSRSGLIELQLSTVNVSADWASNVPDLHEGQYVRLAVRDDGCGMDRDTLARIFDPFFTTKSSGAGTGLGLSVVHGIMKSHEGAIAVYSQPDKGTTFHLYFPFVEGAMAATALKPREIARGHGERVLYVDDESALVFLIERALKRLGYTVVGHCDPLAALEEFRAHPQAFDLVVTDLSMPRLSGFDLARAMLAVRPDIPILMTSGYVQPEDRETALQMGLHALILKPNTIEELSAELDHLFRHYRAPEPPQ